MRENRTCSSEGGEPRDRASLPYQRTPCYLRPSAFACLVFYSGFSQAPGRPWLKPPFEKDRERPSGEAGDRLTPA